VKEVNQEETGEDGADQMHREVDVTFNHRLIKAHFSSTQYVSKLQYRGVHPQTGA